MGNPNPHPLTDEARARGRETQRRNREERRRQLEEGLDEREALTVALDRLVLIARNGDDTAAIAAAKEIIHQLAGRPAQTVEHGGGDGGPVRIVVQSAFAEPAA